MTAIKVPNNLPALVKARFNAARGTGDITYYPTQVAVVQIESVPFQLRFAPALAHKPQGALKKGDNAGVAHDPFADPSAALVVAPLPPDHVLVLNKFAVVPEHFILATRAFRPQTHLLDVGDLGAAWACVEAYEDGAGGLFAFFNSGVHSGASQPHRHLQLLPVARMRDGLEAAVGGDGGGGGGGGSGVAWDVLAERLVPGRGGSGGESSWADKVPFRTFTRRLRRLDGEDERVDAGTLHAAYLELYAEACAAVLGGAADADNVGTQTEGEEARISYNLALTRDVMVLCPRLAEGAAVVAGGRELGRLSLNGTVLAGTVLVKTQDEWDAVRVDPRVIGKVLACIGLPSSSSSSSFSPASGAGGYKN